MRFKKSSSSKGIRLLIHVVHMISIWKVDLYIVIALVVCFISSLAAVHCSHFRIIELVLPMLFLLEMMRSFG